MPSKFDTKFEAALDKVAQSAKARPWKRPLFWVAAAAFVLFSILKETLEGFFEATENISFPNDPPVEDEKTQAEINARAAMEGWLSFDPRVAASFNAAEYYVEDGDQWR